MADCSIGTLAALLFVAVVHYLGIMRVRVMFLGMLKDLAGHPAEEVELASNATAGELWKQLRTRVPALERFDRAIAIAVNQHYSSRETVLKEGDEVALLPPVSGGVPDASADTAKLPLVSAHCRLQMEPVDAGAVLRGIKRGEDGAVCLFDGIVRNNTRGRKTLYLDYEAYASMAITQMEELAGRALAEFAVRDVAMVHRLGRLEIGDTSVLIAVSSAHRGAAFEACRFLIDTLKKTVPIWKKEYFEDGAVWADGDPFPPEVPTFTS